MASIKDDSTTFERKTALFGGGSLVAALALDQWEWIADTGVIDDVMTTMEVGGGLAAALAYAHFRRRTSPAAEWRKLFRSNGWARAGEFNTMIGERGIRKVGRQVRPSLATREGRDGYKTKGTDYGQFLGRAVTGSRLVRGRKVYAGYERSMLLVAPPGMGKTAMMLHSLLDAPGSLLVASTKADVYELTHKLRALLGPVYLFNPQGVGNVLGDLRWDPLVDCEHYQAATDRATALVKGTKAITAMQEASWGEKCIEILSKYLMAARLADRDLNTVAYWLSRPDDEEAVRILRAFPDVVPAGWAQSLQAELRSDADRMKGSIWSLARGAVAFMSNPLINAACSKGAGQSFNAREFARSRGTLYLLGDDRDETIAPLLNAFTSYVHEEVKAAAADYPKGRLDPPFGFLLDEVTKITPVPLEKWVADDRAAGMYVTAVIQAFSQLVDRWGPVAADTLQGLLSKVIFGGIQNDDDLEMISKLVDDREEQRKTKGKSRSKNGTTESTSVTSGQKRTMPPGRIRKLPPGHALVLLGNANAVVVRFKKGQIRAEKALQKLLRAEAKAAANAAKRGTLAAGVAGPARPGDRTFGDPLTVVQDNPVTRTDDQAGAA